MNEAFKNKTAAELAKMFTEAVLTCPLHVRPELLDQAKQAALVWSVAFPELKAAYQAIDSTSTNYLQAVTQASPLEEPWNRVVSAITSFCTLLSKLSEMRLTFCTVQGVSGPCNGVIINRVCSASPRHVQ